MAAHEAKNAVFEDMIYSDLVRKETKQRAAWQKKFGTWLDDADKKDHEQYLESRRFGPPSDHYKYQPTLTRRFNVDNPEEGIFKPNDHSIPKCAETRNSDIPGAF